MFLQPKKFYINSEKIWAYRRNVFFRNPKSRKGQMPENDSKPIYEDFVRIYRSNKGTEILIISVRGSICWNQRETPLIFGPEVSVCWKWVTEIRWQNRFV